MRVVSVPTPGCKGNYSRSALRAKIHDIGDPVGVERLGIALEPTADYERRADGSGGCEDARVTFVEPLQHYVMTNPALRQRLRHCPGNVGGRGLDTRLGHHVMLQRFDKSNARILTTAATVRAPS